MSVEDSLVAVKVETAMVVDHFATVTSYAINWMTVVMILMKYHVLILVRIQITIIMYICV